MRALRFFGSLPRISRRGSRRARAHGVAVVGRDGLDEAFVALAVANRYSKTGREEMPDKSRSFECSDDLTLEQQLTAIRKTESDEQPLSFLRHSARADEQPTLRDVLRHAGDLGFGGAEVGHHLLAVTRKRSF